VVGGFNCSQAGGISQDGICCLKSCGECSGTGCSQKKGGARGCCSGEIHRKCSATVGAPCRLSGGGPSPPEKWPEPDATANKTWLMFESVIVAAGEAEIPAKGTLVTSVEQTQLTGTQYALQSSASDLPWLFSGCWLY